MAECGDGVVDPDEACDDGNQDDGDGCSATCATEPPSPSCGDGVLDPDEACDDGRGNSDAQADACRTDCQLPACGDAVVDSGEACDDGADNSDSQADACRTTCELATCGDGVVDAGEPCDDGNDIVGDGCEIDCVATTMTTWDPLTAGAAIELSNGNLTITGMAPQCGGGVRATTSRLTGKWYWEVTAAQDGGSNSTQCPVISGLVSEDGALQLSWYGYWGTLAPGATVACAIPQTFVDDGDVIGVAWDADIGNVSFLVNGVEQFECSVPVGTYFPYANHCNDASHHCSGAANFGQAAFAFTPPDGYQQFP